MPISVESPSPSGDGLPLARLWMAARSRRRNSRGARGGRSPLTTSPVIFCRPPRRATAVLSGWTGTPRPRRSAGPSPAACRRGADPVVGGQAEGQVVGVSGVAPAQLLRQPAEPAVEAEAERVGQRRARRAPLGQAARAERDVVRLALQLDDLARRLGADQRQQRGDLLAVAGLAEDPLDARQRHGREEVLDVHLHHELRVACARRRS